MEATFGGTLLSIVISLAIIAITVSVVMVLYKMYRILQSLERVSTHLEQMLHNAKGAVKGIMGETRDQLSTIPGIGFLFHKKSSQPIQATHQHKKPMHTAEFQKPVEKINPPRPIVSPIKIVPKKKVAVKTSQLASPIFGPIPSTPAPSVKKKVVKKKK